MRRLILSLALALLCVQGVSAQGVIIVPGPAPPFPRPDVPPPAAPLVQLRELHLEVRIEGQTAITRVRHTFYNPSDLRLEGTFYHPLPRDAAVTEFALWVGGERTPGEVLPREQARSIYEGIVRRQRDPGLLELVGQGLIQARIFPIEPRSEQKVEIEYTHLVKAEAGLNRYVYPLRIHEAAVRAGFRSAVLTARLQGAAPLRSVYSPSHEVEVKTEGERQATVGFESGGRGLDEDFVLYWSVSPEDVSVHLLTDRMPGDDGAFLLIVAPPRAPDPSERLAKDVVFVLDISGSMREDDRISQAKRALLYGLRGLGAQDRFNLITFGTGVYPMAEQLLPATPENVQRAVSTVEGIVARGGTHISEALDRAFRSFEGSGDTRRPRMIVFVTDGRPTVGVTDPVELLGRVSKRNSSKVRIFCFGVGVDLSTRLLDELASDNHGTAGYVEGKGDMEVAFSSFFDKVDFPALTDLELRIEGVDVYDLHPPSVSDLFFGEQLTILGRYRGTGKGKVVLRGWKEDKQETYEFADLDFGASKRHEFVPRLWAARHIAYLLEEIRRNGENRELIDTIVELGQRWGIPSPYASYLVVEDSELEGGLPEPLRQIEVGEGEEAPTSELRRRASEAGAADTTSAADRPGQPAATPEAAEQQRVLKNREDSGAGAVAVSKQIQEQKEADSLGQTDAGTTTQHVAGRTFYLRDGVWVEAQLLGGRKASQQLVQVQSMEDAWFDLAEASDELREMLSVGERVQFVWNGHVVDVGTEGEAQLSPESRKLLGL